MWFGLPLAPDGGCSVTTSSAPAGYEPVPFDDVQVRRLLPESHRASEAPRWELSIEGRVIGWVEERRLRAATASFYFAIGIEQRSGEQFRLEGSTDFADRVAVVRRFDIDPMTSHQHLGWTATRRLQARDATGR